VLLLEFVGTVYTQNVINVVDGYSIGSGESCGSGTVVLASAPFNWSASSGQHLVCRVRGMRVRLQENTNANANAGTELCMKQHHQICAHIPRPLLDRTDELTN
jgi:hypothetical protein